MQINLADSLHVFTFLDFGLQYGGSGHLSRRHEVFSIDLGVLPVGQTAITGVSSVSSPVHKRPEPKVPVLREGEVVAETMGNDRSINKAVFSSLKIDTDVINNGSKC